jgi:Cu/Ag efflux protein CusF
MKKGILMATLLAAFAVSPIAQAQNHGAHAGHAGHDAHVGQPMPAGAHMNEEMTRGEIRKWDPKTSKLTLRHEEIRHLVMAPMTMVFTVHHPEQMQGLKVGDTVFFGAEQENGKLIVTRIRKP